MTAVARRRAVSLPAEAEVSTLEFRIRFIDASETILSRLHIEACDLAGAVALVEGLAWPSGAGRMEILDAVDNKVHSQLL